MSIPSVEEKVLSGVVPKAAAISQNAESAVNTAKIIIVTTTTVVIIITTGTNPCKNGGITNMIDKDRIEGSAEQAKGKIKEVAGKITGDSKLEADGNADQVAGKIQNAVGGLKDAMRGK